jgi:phospholipase/lecithinase/hemolysin
VTRFLSTDFPQGAPFDALYVVFIGSNDLSDALSDPTNAEGIIGDAIVWTAVNIQRLYLAGARKFLVPNLPDFGLTPYIIALDALYPGQGIKDGATKASVGYNTGLAIALAELKQLPGIEIIPLDVFLALHELVSDPQQAGFKNVDDSCLTFGVLRRAICSTPNKYLFWDGIHPTTAGHDFLSDKAREALAAAP